MTLSASHIMNSTSFFTHSITCTQAASANAFTFGSSTQVCNFTCVYVQKHIWVFISFDYIYPFYTAICLEYLSGLFILRARRLPAPVLSLLAVVLKCVILLAFMCRNISGALFRLFACVWRSGYIHKCHTRITALFKTTSIFFVWDSVT